MTKVFPTILILLDLGAAVMYAINQDWRLAIYWVSASILTASISY